MKISKFKITTSSYRGRKLRTLTSSTRFDGGFEDCSHVVVQKCHKEKWQVRYHEVLRITGEWTNLASRQEAIQIAERIINGEKIKSEFDYEGYFKAISR